jgi:ureidoglycolate hydrolase
MDQFDVTPLELQNLSGMGKEGLYERIKLPISPPQRTNENLNAWDGIFSLNGQFSGTILQVKRRSLILHRMERHLQTPELLITLGKGVIVPMAPPGELRQSQSQAAAYYLPAGEGLLLEPGVWHLAPFPLEEAAQVLVIFKTNTAKDDLEFQMLNPQLQVTLG